MKRAKTKQPAVERDIATRDYRTILSGLVDLLEEARRNAGCSVDAIMTATYWEIGQRIVEFEQQGKGRADYGDLLVARLSVDLTKRFGRGFGPVNLSQMRKFYRLWPTTKIFQTLSEKSGYQEEDHKFQTQSEISQTLSAKSAPINISPTPSAKSRGDEIQQTLSAESGATGKLQTPSERSEEVSRKLTVQELAQAFPLPWSHYVRLLSVDKPETRAFYEAEALRGGWSVRQLDRAAP